jgi:hypothetical protein
MKQNFMNKFYIRGLNKIYQRPFKLAPLKSSLPLRERARVRGFSQVSSSFGISRIVSIIFVITLSLNVAYAEDVELVFKKNEELTAKYFEYLDNWWPKRPKEHDKYRELFFSAHDLNNDGIGEYIVLEKLDRLQANNGIDDGYGHFVYSIFIFSYSEGKLGRLGGLASGKYKGKYVGIRGEVKILESIHNGYHDLLIRCNIPGNKYLVDSFDLKFDMRYGNSGSDLCHKINNLPDKITKKLSK